MQNSDRIIRVIVRSHVDVSSCGIGFEGLLSLVTLIVFTLGYSKMIAL